VPATTLWGVGSSPDGRLLDATAGEDRPWDARLLRWDVLGSLGHVDGLRASGLLGASEHTRLRSGLRRALAAVEQGRLRLGPAH
jgi:argininosuccinate lyase